MRFRQFVLGGAVAASFGFAGTAQAGWLGGQFQGGSSFGLTDGHPGSLTCPLCDSTVNFAAYQNTDGNWTDDDAFSGLNLREFVAGNPVDPSGTVDAGAKYVFFYQILNSDPLNVSNQPLENFNVTKTDDFGNPVDHQPYMSVGYIDGATFFKFDPTPPLDVPNDQVQTKVFDPTPIIQADPDVITVINPTAGRLSNGFEIVSPAVRAGSQAYTGALWEFGGLSNIAAGDSSTVLFLTSNWRFGQDAPCGVRTVYPKDGDPVDKFLCDAVRIVWAETESPGGFGAAGDVVGIKNVPEPGTLALLGLSLAGLAATRRRKQ